MVKHHLQKIIDIIEPLEIKFKEIKKQIEILKNTSIFQKIKNFYIKKEEINLNKKLYKIKDLFENYNGNNKITNKYIQNNNGIFPVYSSQTKNNGIFGNINTYQFDGEYILFTTHGKYYGTFIKVFKKFSTTSNCGILKLKKEFNNKVDLNWFLIYINYLFNKLKKENTSQPFINKKEVLNFNIFIPDIKLQKKLLKKIEKIEKIQKFLNKTEFKNINKIKNYIYSKIIL